MSCDHRWVRYRVNGVSRFDGPLMPIEESIKFSVCVKCQMIHYTMGSGDHVTHNIGYTKVDKELST